jgi:hypothetical protein
MTMMFYYPSLVILVFIIVMWEFVYMPLNIRKNIPTIVLLEVSSSG